MRRKIFIVILSLITIFGAGWVYLADKFEQSIKNKFLPALEHNKALGNVNLDKVEIKKYAFTLNLKDIVLFPNLPNFVIKTDSLTAKFHPFTGQVSAYCNGEKLTIGSGETEIYILKPSDIIEFNKSLLEGKWENANITVRTPHSTIYYAPNGKIVTENTDQEIKFSIKPKDDNYVLSLVESGKEFTGPAWANYCSNLILKILPSLNNKDKFLVLKEKIEKGLQDIVQVSIDNDQILGATAYNLQYNIDIDKQYLAQLYLFLRGENDILKVVRSFTILPSKHSLNFDVNCHDLATKSHLKLFLDKREDKVTVHFKCAGNYNYDVTQEAAITKAIASSMLQDYRADNIIGLSVEDFLPFASFFVSKIKDIGLDIDIEYDIASANFTNSIRFNINENNFDLKGEKIDTEYKGIISLARPDLLITEIAELYNEGVVPFISKTQTAEETEYSRNLINNLTQNGLNTLKALHKDNDFKEGEAFVAGFSIDPQKFSFKMNNKSFVELITDDRIITFLKNMPVQHEESISTGKQSPN